jgi:Potential Queuosine, Q, salvage protein family
MDSIPGFVDTATVHGHTVTFARKAQMLVSDLYCRFAPTQPLFNFVDMADIGPDSGAYPIAVMRCHGCIKCLGAWSKDIAIEAKLPAGMQERALRAACVVATSRVAAKVGVAAWQLSRWIQTQTDSKKDHLSPHRTIGVVTY